MKLSGYILTGVSSAIFNFQVKNMLPKELILFLNPIALRRAKASCIFGHSECNRVKIDSLLERLLKMLTVGESSTI